MAAAAGPRQPHLTALVVSVSVVLIALSVATAGGTDFPRWLLDFRAEVVDKGIAPETIERAFTNLKEPLSRVIELDRRQPETLRTSAEYVASRVTGRRVEQGKQMLRRYPTWLGIIEREYAVQRRFLVALWGIETDYGRATGKFPVIHSLASLAYDGRRGSHFRQELIQALRMLDHGYTSLSQMRGSWAGAMGQCQFMPSTFLTYGVDADNDGTIDLWRSMPDALASAANYLAAEGWRDGQTWGCRVHLPVNFEPGHAGMNKRMSLATWQNLGVRRLNGSDLAKRDLDASLVLPDGPDGPAYLVYDNFRVLMRWNHSISFALAVGTLADRIGAE